MQLTPRQLPRHMSPPWRSALRARRRIRSMLTHSAINASTMPHLVHALPPRAPCADTAADARGRAWGVNPPRACTLRRALSGHASATEPPTLASLPNPSPSAAATALDNAAYKSSAQPPQPGHPSLPTIPFPEFVTSRSQWSDQRPVRFQDVHMRRAAAKLDDFKVPHPHSPKSLIQPKGRYPARGTSLESILVGRGELGSRRAHALG